MKGIVIKIEKSLKRSVSERLSVSVVEGMEAVSTSDDGAMC